MRRKTADVDECITTSSKRNVTSRRRQRVDNGAQESEQENRKCCCVEGRYLVMEVVSDWVLRLSGNEEVGGNHSSSC